MNIAIHFADFNAYGCPQCGCSSATCYLSGNGTTCVQCLECKEAFYIVSDHLSVSTIGHGDPAVFPEVSPHPRAHVPAHNLVVPDNPPPEGEYFAPRGVGYDLAGFVRCKQAGERIVQMFTEILRCKPKTFLDYRPNEPLWIQVKVKAEDHIDLEKLNELTQNGIITKQKIQQCLIQV